MLANSRTGVIKQMAKARYLCVLTLLLSACQSLPDIESRLGALNFDLDSSSYIVRAGETLESIAFRYDTSAETLRQLNPHAANGVHSGMTLTLRQPAAGSANSVIQQAGWSNSNSANTRTANSRSANTRDEVRISATQQQQTIPRIISQITSPAEENSDIALLNNNVQGNRAARYIEQPGCPVEEVIEDENFQLPVAAPATNDLPEYRGGWQWPLDGQLARDYDPRRPNGRGIEIVGIPGDKVQATRSGVVDWVARSPDGVGKVVIIRHADDYLSIYSNAQDLFVSMNDTVKQGADIASLGANINDEPLLRFEISKDGNLLNPMDFLNPR